MSAQSGAVATTNATSLMNLAIDKPSKCVYVCMYHMQEVVAMRLVVELPDKVHRDFHSLAKDRETTASNLVRSFIIASIDAKERRKSSGKSGTGG